MEISCATDGAVSTILLSGAFEAGEVERIEDQINGVLRDGPSILEIDMRDVTFIDSKALGALVSTHHRAARHHARLKLANVSQPVALILQLTKLVHFFTVDYDTQLDEAG